MTKWAVARWMLAVIAACILPAIALPARAGDAPTFSADGWLARCDAGVCKASLPSADHDEALLLSRWPGNDGVAVGVAAPRNIADRARPIDLRIDDGPALTLHPGREYAALERAETLWIIDTKTANLALRAMLKAKRLRLSYLDVLGAPHDADFDLNDLGKIIDFFDLQQHVTTNPAVGAAPPATVPKAPEMRRIDLITRMGIPERLLIRHAHASDCEDPGSPKLKLVATVIGELSQTAILYAIPCLVSGAEISYKLWVIETGEIGGMTPLFFALYDPTFGWKGSDLLYNVSFEQSGARLTSTRKPTDKTDCGHQATWHWKGYGFALDNFELSRDCSRLKSLRIFPPP